MDFSALNSVVLDVFGEDVATSPVTIDGVTVQAVFDSRHFADEEGEAGTSDLITTISVRSSVLPALTDETPIIARGIIYRRWEARPDGQGMTAIQLERLGTLGFDFSPAVTSQYLPLLYEMAGGFAPSRPAGLRFSSPPNSQYIPILMEA